MPESFMNFMSLYVKEALLCCKVLWGLQSIYGLGDILLMACDIGDTILVHTPISYIVILQ